MVDQNVRRYGRDSYRVNRSADRSYCYLESNEARARSFIDGSLKIVQSPINVRTNSA